MGNPKLQIAIDGPAGAGKSTVAKAVAKELDILYLDTGAMYRAIALFALNRGVDPTDSSAVLQLLPEADVAVAYRDGTQCTMLCGRDVSGEIRTPAVSKGASDIAVHAAVRIRLVELQREVAAQTSVVMDGRDIGTYVLPQAPYKFYITASPRVRAERRLLELQAQGEQASLEELTKTIIARDHTDSTREFAPLCQADDAVLVDTTNMSIRQAVDAVLAGIRGSIDCGRA